MFNWYRNEKGSVMVSVLIMGLVAAVLGAGIGIVGLNNKKQVEQETNSVRAHYYAKSGVEVAMGLIISNYDSNEGISDSILDQWFYGGIDTGFTKDENNPPDHNISFRISLDDTKSNLIIESWGYVRRGDRVVVGMESVGYMIDYAELKEIIGGSTGGSGGVPMALFAENGIVMTGSIGIIGTVATNSTKADAVVFETTNIEQGDLYIGVSGDPDTVVSIPNWSPVKERIHHGEIKNLEEPLNFPLPIFPGFPEDLPSRGSFDTPEEESYYYISEDGYYDEIKITSDRKVSIDLKNGTRVIRVKRLNIEQGSIKLLNVGPNSKLVLYVDDSIFIGGDSQVNFGGNYRNVDVFYKGSSSLSFPGNTRFVGSLFAESADISILESGGFTGDIVTGGTDVKVSGNVNAYTRVLYAPNAKFHSDGSGRTRGTVVVKSALIEGGGDQIIGDYSYDLSFFNSLNWPSGRAPSLQIGGEGEDRGTWQYKGRWTLGTS